MQSLFGLATIYSAAGPLTVCSSMKKEKSAALYPEKVKYILTFINVFLALSVGISVSVLSTLYVHICFHSQSASKPTSNLWPKIKSRGSCRFKYIFVFILLVLGTFKENIVKKGYGRRQ